MKKSFIDEICRRHAGESHFIIEISGRATDAEKSYKAGDWNIWSSKRIKGAFDFGNGTMRDMKRYAADNRQYATFINLFTGEIL